jgi:predicted metal-binding membrane protein
LPKSNTTFDLRANHRSDRVPFNFAPAMERSGV